MTTDKHPLLSQSLYAKHDTWLTTSAHDPDELDPTEKLFVQRGSAWEWVQIIISAGTPFREVRLKAQPETSWYFYQPHWKIINDLDKEFLYKPKKHVQLNTPYIHQLGTNDTNCFSASCAMLLMSLKDISPEEAKDYMDAVCENGESSEAWVQVKTLEQYGLHAEFRQDGDWNAIEQLLRDEIPVPLGILHAGPVDNPGGTGHWVCAVGITEDQKYIIVHNSLGDLDLDEGVYESDHGAHVKYEKTKLAPRWMVEKGYSSGWYIKAKP